MEEERCRKGGGDGGWGRGWEGVASVGSALEFRLSHAIAPPTLSAVIHHCCACQGFSAALAPSIPHSASGSHEAT